LPIHAAGTYNTNSIEDTFCLSDYCVVSYTPTLEALARCQAQSTATHPVNVKDNVKILLAAAPEPCISTALPAARREMDIISNIVSANFFIPSIPDPTPESAPHCVSTAEEVLKLLPDATVLHLACHGRQNASNPLESGFIMHDKMMQVGDIIRLSLPNARLAFLSACETARGDIERPDEALHLAATMLYVGFKSVVGTMWSMGDVDGPVVAETVYRELFGGAYDMLDFEIVPYALDTAVRKLRAQGLEPSRWAPYIHLGM
jgi:CHAT domain-containing protein